MNSISMQKHAPPLVFCPGAPFITDEEEFRWLQFGEPPEIPLPSDESSSFSDISLLYNTKCPFCLKSLVGTTFHSCESCRFPGPLHATGYHKECLEPTSKHPYHPKHSLLPRSNRSPRNICLGCSQPRDWVYGCSICDFTMCRDCARGPPLLEIYHPKRHEHTLFYIPTKSPFYCDVCGLNEHISLIYSCRQCDFAAHKKCVYFPFIMRISRHEHRLSFNSSLTPEKWLCEVCRGRIYTHYGRYICVKKDCSYGVHSKCATREDVWDGKELEGVPEDAYEDTKSFKEISDGVIQHFSHQNHHMRLDQVTNRPFDENRRCQACALPICDDIIYNCMECDFTLHQGCAYLPRKKQHATHPHPLSLQVDHQKGWFECKTCRRTSNSFMYSCYEKDCNYILDVCCTSVSVPLDHWCHPHTLFITSTPKSSQHCSMCVSIQYRWLNCVDCEFVLCFGCATLPKKLKYKYDEHYLSFSYDKDATCQYLCDACEKDAKPKNGVYMCNVCNITLHINCLLGEDMYMQPGGITRGRRNVYILPNNHLTRTKCNHCHNRCKEKVMYKSSDKEMFCSMYCLPYYSFYLEN